MIRIRTKEEASVKRKKSEKATEKVPDTHKPMERVRQIQSMVMTAQGELVSASSERSPETLHKDRTPLRRTQRRNANRRKHRALDRLEKREAKESAAERTPVTEEEVHVQPVEKISTRLPTRKSEPEATMEPALPEYTPAEPCMGCPRCNADIVKQTPSDYTPAEPFMECPECNVLRLERYGSLAEYTAASMVLRSKEHPDVEPYVPQFVEPRQ